MTRGAAHPDAELADALVDLAAHLAVPDASSIGALVRARLIIDDSTIPRGRRSSFRPRTQVLLAAAALVLAVTLVFAVSSATRRAVADFFGLRGVQIEQNDRATLPVGSGLSLGTRVELDEARRRIDFELALPARSQLGTPDAVYLGDVPHKGRVTLAYAPRAGLPKTGTTGVGLLLTEFHATIPEPVLQKTLAAGTNLEQVTVDGAPGYWFSGAPHTLSLADSNGNYFTDQTRLAGNTLLWQRGQVTYRIESALPRAKAIRIAASLRP